MSDFRKLEDGMFACPQIGIADIAVAHELGIALIINNRPDGEASDEPQGAEIKAAADAVGINYRAIPVSHAGFSEPQVDAMTAALEEAKGPVLAYCRSGTRSTFLWALARAKAGRNPEELARLAAGAGYDISPIRSMMDMFAGK